MGGVRSGTKMIKRLNSLDRNIYGKGRRMTGGFFKGGGFKKKILSLLLFSFVLIFSLELLIKVASNFVSNHPIFIFGTVVLLGIVGYFVFLDKRYGKEVDLDENTIPLRQDNKKEELKINRQKEDLRRNKYEEELRKHNEKLEKENNELKTLYDIQAKERSKEQEEIGELKLKLKNVKDENERKELESLEKEKREEFLNNEQTRTKKLLGTLDNIKKEKSMIELVKSRKDENKKTENFNSRREEKIKEIYEDKKENEIVKSTMNIAGLSRIAISQELSLDEMKSETFKNEDNKIDNSTYEIDLKKCKTQNINNSNIPLEKSDTI